MPRICLLPLLLCLTVPALARPVPVLRVAPGKVVTVPSARVRDYVSPDGKYIVRISPQYGEGGEEVPSFTVLPRRAGGRARRDIGGWPSVTNFAWLPHHPHSLVVALNSDGNSQGDLLLCTGTRRPVILRHGKYVSDEDFSIEAVSAAGRTLIYKRYGYDTPVPGDRKSAKRQILTLPPGNSHSSH